MIGQPDDVTPEAMTYKCSLILLIINNRQKGGQAEDRLSSLALVDPKIFVKAHFLC